MLYEFNKDEELISITTRQGVNMFKESCDRCHKSERSFVPFGGTNKDKTKKQFHRFYICRPCADDFCAVRETFEYYFIHSYEIKD